MAISRVKLITFDVTGTLLKFHKPPIEFYKEWGMKHGVLISDNQKLATAFKEIWKRMNEESPHFGIRWETWWQRFVVQTFRGVSFRTTHSPLSFVPNFHNL
jgi:FMN phosphatase YigB (HAD superfamily)